MADPQQADWQLAEDLWQHYRVQPSAQAAASLRPALRKLGRDGLDFYGPRAAELAIDNLRSWLRTPAPGPSTNGSKPQPLDRPENTDWRNAERLIALHGQDLRYCYPWGKWLVWTGPHWHTDDMGAVKQKAKDTVRQMYYEAAAADNESVRKALARWAPQSEAETRLEAMLSSAQSEPGVPVLPDTLDADPWLLNLHNGTFPLREGEALQPHRREDMLTKMAGTAYDPDAKAPLWEAFLDKVFAGDQELISFVQRAAGYSLTGATSERVMFILHGGGKNGKTTLIETIASVLGDYAKRTPTSTFFDKRDNAIPNDLAALKGIRLVYASEGRSGQHLDEAMIKDVTGGDTISARFMRGEWFEFRPQFKLWLSTNHMPVIRGTDEAIWDRLRKIPFTVRIADAEMDKDLKAKLIQEAPGILTWLIEGCLAWQVMGLGTANAVQSATQQYREEMDTLGDFIEARCYLDPQAVVTRARLYAVYQAWCEATGETPMPTRSFTHSIRERGVQDARGGQKGRFWRGLGLVADVTQ